MTKAIISEFDHSSSRTSAGVWLYGTGQDHADNMTVARGRHTELFVSNDSIPQLVATLAMWASEPFGENRYHPQSERNTLRVAWLRELADKLDQ